MSDRSPLTATERRQAIAWVSEHDAQVGEALAKELELDPAMRILLRSTDKLGDQMAGMRQDMVEELRAMRTDIAAEQRTTRWMMTAVQLFAMAVLAGMVGLSASIGGGSLPSIQVTPQGVEAAPSRKGLEGSDDAAQVGDTAYDVPGPRLAP